MNTFAALIVFLALWFLYFTGREGLSAEPPRVGVDRPVGDWNKRLWGVRLRGVRRSCLRRFSRL